MSETSYLFILIVIPFGESSLPWLSVWQTGQFSPEWVRWMYFGGAAAEKFPLCFAYSSHLFIHALTQAQCTITEQSHHFFLSVSYLRTSACSVGVRLNLPHLYTVGPVRSDGNRHCLTITVEPSGSLLFKSLAWRTVSLYTQIQYIVG